MIEIYTSMRKTLMTRGTRTNIAKCTRIVWSFFQEVIPKEGVDTAFNGRKWEICERRVDNTEANLAVG